MISFRYAPVAMSKSVEAKIYGRSAKAMLRSLDLEEWYVRVSEIYVRRYVCIVYGRRDALLSAQYDRVQVDEVVVRRRRRGDLIEPTVSWEEQVDGYSVVSSTHCTYTLVSVSPLNYHSSDADRRARNGRRCTFPVSYPPTDQRISESWSCPCHT